MIHIENQLMAIAKRFRANFTFNNKPISHADVFKDTGLLPAIAQRADQLCSLCLGYGIGVSFDESEDGLLGKRVIFDDVTPNIIRYMCIADVIYELVSSGPSPEVTPLDELMYD
jgi:intracellular multiplication protein IcmS